MCKIDPKQAKQEITEQNLLKVAPLKRSSVFFFVCFNGENWRKQRTACRRCRRVPPRREFVQGCGSRRIRHLRRIPCWKWKTKTDDDDEWLARFDDDDDGHEKSIVGFVGPSSKHELKASYWTEGVPSEKKRSGFGQTAMAAEN